MKCQCECGCDEIATKTDEGGNPVCDECSEYAFDDDGNFIGCGASGLGEMCHVCLKEISWGEVLTGGFGNPNYRLGDCTCGENSWIDECKGDWGHFRFRG